MIVDELLTVPLYSVTEAADVIDVPPQTFRNWARGYVVQRPGRPDVIGEPVVTSVGAGGREASIPFVGLAEGYVLAAIRRSGVAMQRIRPALKALERELGVDHALASKGLYTDGAELLYDYATTSDDPVAAELVVLRNGQRVFRDVVQDYLRRISFSDDGWALRITLPQYRAANVIVDPRFGFGQPTFARGRARVSDALERFWAGEDLRDVAEEFGVPNAELEDAVRVASRRAA
jgi:uncharacterized protein (DUF433 family)